MSGFFATPQPRQFAHRGASGTHPENTLAAFRAARSLGAPAFELDVHASADGEIVVIHDPTLERTTSGSGPVRQHSLSELKSLDAGYRFSVDQGRTFPFRNQGIRIPTLREVIEAFPDVAIIVEIKQLDPPIEPALHDVLQQTGAADRVMVFSLDQAPLDRFRALDPTAATGMGPRDVSRFKLRLATRSWRGYAPPGIAFAVPVRWRGLPIVTPRFVDAAHRWEREVYVWTVDEAPRMSALFDLGVDGIITNFPDRLRGVVAARSV